jgi:hypothetical protein
MADRLLTWEDLRGLRIGLATTVARPDRVRTHLADKGIVPVVVRTFSDHARPRLRHAPGIDVWLATAKCAANFRESHVAVLDHDVILEPSLLDAVCPVPLDPRPTRILPSQSA